MMWQNWNLSEWLGTIHIYTILQVIYSMKSISNCLCPLFFHIFRFIWIEIIWKIPLLKYCELLFSWITKVHEYSENFLLYGRIPENLTTVLPLFMLWRSLWACAQKSTQEVTPENGRPSFKPSLQSLALSSKATCKT